MFFNLKVGDIKGLLDFLRICSNCSCVRGLIFWVGLKCKDWQRMAIIDCRSGEITGTEDKKFQLISYRPDMILSFNAEAFPLTFGELSMK